MEHESLCPRCAYDLSGEVTRWRASCPVDGVCPECGQGFGWSEVLREDRRLVEGFVEHTKEGWATRRAALRTWLWAAWPWVFWGRVGVRHRMDVGRAFGWLVILIAPAQALLAAADFCRWLLGGRTAAGLKEMAVEAASCVGWPIVEVAGGGGLGVRLVPLLHTRDYSLLVGAWVMTLAWPVLMHDVAWPGVRESDRVRHVVRAAVYSCWWVVLFWWLAAIRQVLKCVHALAARSGVLREAAWEVYDGYKDVLRDVIRMPLLPLALVSAMLAAWWYVTMTRGFRMRGTGWRWWVYWSLSTVLGVTVWIGVNLARSLLR